MVKEKGAWLFIHNTYYYSLDCSLCIFKKSFESLNPSARSIRVPMFKNSPRLGIPRADGSE